MSVDEMVKEIARSGDPMPTGFAAMYRGFWMVFENGITLSVQFCYGNYCDNQDNELLRKIIHVYHATPIQCQCKNAEILISNRAGKNITHEFAKDGDRIEEHELGDITPERLGEIIARIKRRKK